MFDTATLHLEKLGSRCGSYRLERVLHHDTIRTTYVAASADQVMYELHLFQENYYAAETVHGAIEDYVKTLQKELPEHVQKIVDVGFSDDREPYLVAETQNGDLLSRILDHRRVIGIDECLRLGISAAQTLHELHKRGIVHGCLSSRCVWVDQDRVLLGNVGIGHIAAMAIQAGRESAGIPLYMSFEQLKGKAASIESDAYALALILYECITGLPPHSSATVSELALQRCKAPCSLTAATDVRQPSEVELFFRKALSVDRSKRYADAEELRDALLSVQRREPALPKLEARKIPHRYRIVRHSSATNLAELQRVDAAAVEGDVRAHLIRNKLVISMFLVAAAFAGVLYALTLACLNSMHQEISVIRANLNDARINATAYGSDKFVLNPPQISKSELTGSTKLDSVMKFCSGYGLRADDCVGDFHRIRTLRKLEYLSLTNTNVTNDVIKEFVILPLKAVDVSNCKRLTAESFQVLQNIPSMRVLYIEGIKLLPENLSNLNRRLIALRLKSCKLTDACVAHLTECRDLTRLELQNNQLTDESLKYLVRLPQLYFVDLRDNPGITDSAVQEFAAAMPDTEIRFKSNKTANVVRLGNSKLDGSAVRLLEKEPHLATFSASGAPLKDEDLAHLNRNLRSLDLSSCQISDRGIKHLSRLKNLVTLNLNNCGLTGESFSVFHKLHNLRELDLRDCSNISTEQAKTFEDSLPNTVVYLNRIKQ